MTSDLEQNINELWQSDVLDSAVIELAVGKLDSGELRVAEKLCEEWIVHEYLKKAVLLYFRLMKTKLLHTYCGTFFDKIPLKVQDWTEADFVRAGFRMVPGAIVRRSAYIAKEVVLMPCFVNVGAYVDGNTMIDSNALVGSCAQIGRNCHISDGVTIGGVLEPLQASPVIIEDGCFIGAKSVITEGVIVGMGSVIAAGTVLSASTKIIDRDSAEIMNGVIPPYSVVVSGSYRSTDTLNINCAVIIKKVTAQTRQKTSINELLREM